MIRQINIATGDITEREHSAAELSDIEANKPTLAQLAAAKLSQIEQWRDEARFMDVTAHGRQWQADKTSQELLTGALTFASLSGVYPSEWRDATNLNMTITGIPDLVAIAGAMMAATQFAYGRSWTLKSQVEAATTVSQVDEVVW